MLCPSFAISRAMNAVYDGTSTTTTWDFNKPATYPSYPGYYLKSGTSGNEVRFIQTCLNWLGYDCGTVDGQFGSATEAQVRYFQSDLGFGVDGVVGPDTWNALIGHVGLNDIGSGFWAYIVNRPDWRHIENTGTNIQIAANGLDTTDPKQIWYFERTSDGRYRITSAYDGNRIDLYNLEANNGTNIQSWPPNETAAQEWIVYYSFDGGSYGFRSACGSVVMDCVGASTAPGTNVQAWEYNKGTAQQFMVCPLSNDGINYSKPSAPSVPTLTVKSGNPVSFSWTSSPLKDSRYDNRVYRLRIWEGSSAGLIGTEIIKKDYTGTSCELQLEPGTYTARVNAINTKYASLSGHSEPVTFTVKNCSHEWNWVTDKEASCTENGVKHEECSLCGEVRSENTQIPATGHSWDDGTITTPATCLEEGIKTYTCSSCDATKTETIAVLAHDYSGEAVSLRNGTHQYLCLNGCGKYGVGAAEGATENCSFGKWTTVPGSTVVGDPCQIGYSEQRFCSVCRYEERQHISRTNHQAGEAIIENLVEADCEHDGSYDEVYYCTRLRAMRYVCGKEISRKTVIIPATGHTEEPIPAVSATCTKTGLTEGVKCSVCGKVLVEPEFVEVIGHDYAATFTVDKAATCTEEGSKSRHCTRCETKTDVTAIPATGHTDGEWIVDKNSDCINGGSKHQICSVCGETMKIEEIPALGHDYTSVVTAPTCTTDGYTTHTCTVCGDSYMDSIVKATGHRYDNDCDDTCNVCGETREIEHAYGAWVISMPTCATAGAKERTCSVCGKVERIVIPAPGHSYDNDCDTTCNTCGATRSVTHAYGTWKTTKAATCTADGVKERTCSVCDKSESVAIPKLGHDYEATFTVDKAATCMETGSKSRHCTRCDARIDVTVVPATGHSYDNDCDTACNVCGATRSITHAYGAWKTTKTATCTTDGVKERTCSVCGDVDRAVLTKLGHNYATAYTVDKAATCTETGSKSRHCTRCDAKTDVTVIPVTEHSYMTSEQAREVNAQLDRLNAYSHALVLHDEGSKQERKDIQEDFKKGKIDILVVYNMLLTGFDAPRLKKQYLARMIKAHNLLQTLTRVNRPYRDYHYNMKNVESYIKSFSHGTTTKTITKDDVRGIEVYFHDRPMQDAIANFLTLIDDKIQNNKDVIYTLRKTIKLLYDYWFIQFDFPDKDGKPYKSHGGKFQYSTSLKRNIPEGWTELPIGKRLTFERGVEIGSDNYLIDKQENSVPFIRVSDLNGSSEIHARIDLLDGKLLCPQDVCVSLDGTVGKVDYALYGGYSTGIRRVYDEKAEINNALIFAILTSDYIQYVIDKYATGSNILHASEAVNHMDIPYSKEAYGQFQTMITPMFEKMIKVKLENEKLQSYKNLILPMLMNGQVIFGEDTQN